MCLSIRFLACSVDLGDSIALYVISLPTAKDKSRSWMMMMVVVVVVVVVLMMIVCTVKITALPSG